MKRLFVVMMTCGLLFGMYAATIGLGVAYDGIGSETSKPYGMEGFVSIRADIMIDILPVLGFRAGLLHYDFKSDFITGESRPEYEFGTGVYGGMYLTLPVPLPMKPYFPFHVIYCGAKDEPSMLVIDGGIGGIMAFGPLQGYLEGGVRLLNATLPPETESNLYNWFYVQGGVRVPITL